MRKTSINAGRRLVTIATVAVLAVALGGCSVLRSFGRVPQGVLMTLCELAAPVGAVGPDGSAELRIIAAVAGTLCETARETGDLREVIVPADHEDALEVARRLVEGQEFFVDGLPRPLPATPAARSAAVALLAGEEVTGGDISHSVTAIAIAPRDAVGKLNRMDPPRSLRPRGPKRPWKFWRWGRD